MWSSHVGGRRGGRRRLDALSVAVTSFATVCAVLVWPAPEAGAASTAAPALSEGQQALATAEESGQQVEVTGERTDRSTVFANPDGSTFTLEQSAIPVRVAKPGGGWQAPDPTLVKRSDGTVAPRAAAVDMSFSGGGSGGALARIADAGKSLALSWPEKLPVPVLDGASAVYGDVLPDVDLRVTATPESFQHVLVVKSAKAAADPALKKLEFGLKTSGLKVGADAAGNLSAVDGDGNAVFRAPAAQMWNSAGRSSEDKPTGALAAKSLASGSATGGAVPGDPSETAASGSGLQPGQGDDVARMDVHVSKDALTVVPDGQMLRTASGNDFPVFIDPTVTWGESERTLLRSDGYKSYGWGNGSDDQGMGAGKCGSWSGYYCGPGYVQRLYFEFSPSSLKGKKVLDATFRVTEPWAFQCSPRTVDLIRTPDNISSSTTWASRPQGGWDTMVDRSVSAGRGSLCDPDSPRAPIEFKDSPSEPNENLTPTVQSFAAGKFSRLTLMLKAHDETDTSAWKRFKNDAVLAVKFVGLPAKPTGIGLNVGNKPVCETSASDPLITSDPTPALMTTPQTASGGEKDAQLRGAMSVDKKAADGTWASAFTDIVRPTTGYVGDNVKVTAPTPTLTEGTLYRYRSWARSYYDSGKSYLPGPSNGSTTGWCYFKVDPARPHGPTVKVGAPYTECTPNACTSGGGPGQKGTFTFTPASGDTDVTGYEYKLSSGTTWVSAGSGTSVSKDITPDDAGTERLYVRAKDSIGWGAQSVVDFLVAAGQGPIGDWHFNEDNGPAVDSGTAAGAPRRDAALSTAGAVRDDRGRRGELTRDSSGALLDAPVTDRGLSLDGKGGYAATDGPVLETRSAYTVSAWVRLKDTTPNSIVLSQDGSQYSPFILSYDRGLGTWFFGIKQQDADTGTAYYGVRDLHPAQTGVWTYLVGTYDPAKTESKLYVNGVLQGTGHSTGSWSAAGGLQIGRYKWAGTYQYNFPGTVDEVAVWQRALTAREVADQARLTTSDGFAGAELVADWNPAGASGSALVDAVSGYGKDLSLSGGALLDGESIVLDGTSGAATAAGPLVDDTGSFTVTTLASLDGDKLVAKDIGYTGQVLGQRTADGSAWGLWFELTGKKTVLDEDTAEEKTVPVGFWRFGRLNTDGTFNAVTSDESAELDGPVRLTGVFDAQAGTVSLHVGGVQNDEPKAFTAAVGTGEFALGKGYADGGWGHFVPASIADVRVWAGAMASPEQIEETVGD